jgi:hypothetical protein
MHWLHLDHTHVLCCEGIGDYATAKSSEVDIRCPVDLYTCDADSGKNPNQSSGDVSLNST